MIIKGKLKTWDSQRDISAEIDITQADLEQQLQAQGYWLEPPKPQEHELSYQERAEMGRRNMTPQEPSKQTFTGDDFLGEHKIEPIGEAGFCCKEPDTFSQMVIVKKVNELCDIVNQVKRND